MELRHRSQCIARTKRIKSNCPWGGFRRVRTLADQLQDSILVLRLYMRTGEKSHTCRVQVAHIVAGCKLVGPEDYSFFLFIIILLVNRILGIMRVEYIARRRGSGLADKFSNASSGLQIFVYSYPPALVEIYSLVMHGMCLSDRQCNADR